MVLEPVRTPSRLKWKLKGALPGAFPERELRNRYRGTKERAGNIQKKKSRE